MRKCKEESANPDANSKKKRARKMGRKQEELGFERFKE